MPRRFPPPWTIERTEGEAIGVGYDGLTMDGARCIAANLATVLAATVIYHHLSLASRG
jgi:hypothetical protein